MNDVWQGSGCSIYHIFRLSEVSNSRSRILSLISYRDQFLSDQCHYIYGICLREQTEVDSTQMSSYREIDRIGVFPFIIRFNHAMIY